MTNDNKQTSCLKQMSLVSRMENFDFSTPDITQASMSIYSEIKDEYEISQKAYAEETIHSTNTEQQNRWREITNHELM